MALPTPKKLNSHVATRGRKTLKFNSKLAKNTAEEFGSRLGDCLADLMHAARSKGPDAFERALYMARIHFQDEISDAQ